MSRSERYIPPSDGELERLRQAEEAGKQFDRVRQELLRTALKQVRKADLVSLIIRMAQEEKTSEWIIERELNLDKPVDLLAHDIRVAIDVATKVDDRRLNYNFDYDWRAYEAVRRGLSQLIEKKAIEEAKNLALMLMDKGSYQIACSNEGLMQEEIEGCLRVVIAAVDGSSGAAEWAMQMLRTSRMSYICEQELNELAGHLRDDR